MKNAIVFVNLIMSLRKVMEFCYSNTAYRCAGTDDCHYFRIIDYIKNDLGAEEFLTPVTASYCTRVKESASAFILVVAMAIYITISCNFFRLKI